MNTVTPSSASEKHPLYIIGAFTSADVIGYSDRLESAFVLITDGNRLRALTIAIMATECAVVGGSDRGIARTIHGNDPGFLQGVLAVLRDRLHSATMQGLEQLGDAPIGFVLSDKAPACDPGA